MTDVAEAVRSLLGTGLESKDINMWQMAIRAWVVYVVTVALVRLGKKRFMSKATAADVILGIILGSVVSRAITGNAPLLPAMAAAAALIAIHSLFSAIAVRWHWFGQTIKGQPRLLIRDGKVDWSAMRKAHLTKHDLEEEMRIHQIRDVADIGEAQLERSGDISMLRGQRPPEIVDIKVAEGVQTVRLRLG